ncbi:MAG: HAMP domain-containing protein [Rhizobiales bacterium]|nr:HAMP domain-containing protein [Hyphomicrobiales bacterium]
MFYRERVDAVQAVERTGLAERIASVTRVLGLAEPQERAAMADSASSPRLRFWITDESVLPAPEASDGAVIYAKQFDDLFDFPLREPARFSDELAIMPPSDLDAPRPPPPPPPRRIRASVDVTVSLPFSDHGWLNAQTRIRTGGAPAWPLLISSLILALVMLGLIIFAARRVTRPLKALAASAEAFGRGDAVAPLPESGPDEARRLIHAFNQMQERLSRFVTDRTRMLAAIGHDLRTPITSLKLRAEMVDDEETRQKMRATLDEMQHMTEATLAFARDDAGAEPSRAVDLAALIESAVDDLAEMGKPVSFADAGRLVYSCRPTALKRAIGNLIENAIQYGERARVRLTAAPSGPVIAVEDDGPGIPAERIDEVFKPFTRLESSRSRETGGSGLGLSIARSIVLAHGGTLALRNREDGGLAAEIRLPPG